MHPTRPRNAAAIRPHAWLTTCLALLAGATLTRAQGTDVPKKAPLTRYASLWTKSPFTTPPKPVESTPEVNPFEDLALRGIAPLSEGRYLITLINRKNPTEITAIDTEKTSEYEIEKIERNPERALGTVVHLRKGSIRGTVEYDEKLSVPKLPPKPNQQQAGGDRRGGDRNQPQQQNPNQPPQPGQIPQPAAQPAPGMPGAPGVAPNLRSRVMPAATNTTPAATTPAATTPTPGGFERGRGFGRDRGSDRSRGGR